MKMMLMLILLMSAVPLLAVPITFSATVKPEDHLRSIIDLIQKHNESLSTDGSWMEDVTLLAEGSNQCGERFFCQVHKILVEPKHTNTKKMEVARTLKLFIDKKEYKCEQALEKMNSTGVQIKMPKLLQHLLHCIRYSIFNGGSTSTPVPSRPAIQLSHKTPDSLSN